MRNNVDKKSNHVGRPPTSLHLFSNRDRITVMSDVESRHFHNSFIAIFHGRMEEPEGFLFLIGTKHPTKGLETF